MATTRRVTPYLSPANPSIYADGIAAGLLGVGIVKAVIRARSEVPPLPSLARRAVYGHIFKPLAFYAPLAVGAFIQGRLISAEMDHGIKAGLTIANWGVVAEVMIDTWLHAEKVMGRGGLDKISDMLLPSLGATALIVMGLAVAGYSYIASARAEN